MSEFCVGDEPVFLPLLLEQVVGDEVQVRHKAPQP